MTDEEIHRYREAKRGVTDHLARLDIWRYRLSETDPRLEEYCTEVARNPHRHNLWEQLAVARFFRLIDEYGIERGPVLKFFHFYESMYFPGKGGLTRYRLTPVQCFQFASVYAFWYEDADGRRRRVVKECCLYVPRKFSKTTGTAAFAVYDLLFGEANAEVYIGANSQTQARKCFKVIRQSLMRFDNRGKRFVINEDEVKPARGSKRLASAQCLTANARTKDGLEASTVIIDEFSQARDSDLLNVLTTSMGTRLNPLTVIITTASDVFDGPFYAMLAGYKRLLLGEIEDDSVFCHLFEPDVDDPEDSPATWRKVHPHLGVTVTDDFYEGEWAKAQRNGAEAMLAFRTKLLNLYSENEKKVWISAKLIREHSAHIELEALAGKPAATIGIDLSVRDDFSAVTLAMMDEEHFTQYFKTWYFMPRGGLEGHVNETLYRKWAAEGHLIILDGEVIDYPPIVEHILWISGFVEVLAICYDPYKSLQCVNMLSSTSLGYAVKAFPQTQGHFTSPVQSFEVGIRTGHIVIDDNPINAYCFGNASLDTDRNGNMKPYKRAADSGKIDGVITALMAHQAFDEVVRYV